MRRNIVISLAATALLSSCAYQGTIVEKRFRPVPFSASLGLDAMYNFQLRDSASQIHSQMVTADVFANYRAGDYFNDLQPSPAHNDKELEGFRLVPREMDEGPYQPVRVMQIRGPEKAAANIAVHAYDHVGSVVRVPRWQTVRIVQILGPEKAAAKIAVPAYDHVESAVKVPRWQTVRIVQIQAPEKAAAKVAVPAPNHVAGAVKILRWQTVRVVQVQPRQKSAAKLAARAHPHANSAVKTAASHDRGKRPGKMANDKKKRDKVASTHHRKTVASVN